MGKIGEYSIDSALYIFSTEFTSGPERSGEPGSGEMSNKTHSTNDFQHHHIDTKIKPFRITALSNQNRHLVFVLKSLPQ